MHNISTNDLFFYIITGTMCLGVLGYSVWFSFFSKGKPKTKKDNEHP